MIKNFISIGLVCLLCASCSTTAKLPAGEQLYTGIRKIEVTDEDRSIDGDAAMTEIEAALAYPPNNALLGSSTVRIPLPFGLWVYNAWVDKPGKLNRLIFRNFAAKPVLVSTVNPEIRTKIALNLLHEYGYFDGATTYEVIPHTNDSLKAKILYRITMNKPYLYDSILYRRMQHRADTLLKLAAEDRLLHRGDPFNVPRLEAERQRVASLMRDNGYYYFRPDHIAFQADSTLEPQRISLRAGLRSDVSPAILRLWKIGAIDLHLRDDRDQQSPPDTLQYKDLTLLYHGKLRVRPKELYNQFHFKPGELYSQTKQMQTLSGLNRLGIFQYTEIQYLPQDSSRRCDTFHVHVNATYDWPLNGEMEVNFTANSNKRIGPGAVFSLTRKNLFGGGESMEVKLIGSYEWLMGEKRHRNSLTDNYEYGITGTLTFPRVVLPEFFQREYTFPAFTTFQTYANRVNRAVFFRFLSFGGSATYDFQPNPIRHHAFSPFQLSYNRLERRTALFDSIAGNNKALFHSLKDQFIPSVNYTYTLDNSSVRKGRHTTWWQFSVTESGNLISGIYALAGQGFGEPKILLGNPFSQFLKITSELRYNHAINRNRRIVGRVGVGAIYSYGNSTVSPYSEQFYVGGANSIRAFTIRTIGPGRYRATQNNRFANMDHIGDFKLEMNLEYRFGLVGDLEGALFLDAGNVWLLRGNEDDIPGGRLEWRHFLNDIATGIGGGIRYNMDVLVIRVDVGVALHMPYDTGKRGYFNKTGSDGLGFHIAVGYPF